MGSSAFTVGVTDAEFFWVNLPEGAFCVGLIDCCGAKPFCAGANTCWAIDPNAPAAPIPIPIPAPAAATPPAPGLLAKSLRIPAPCILPQSFPKMSRPALSP